MRSLSRTRSTMWSKPATAMGLLMRRRLGAGPLQQKPEEAAVAPLAVLEDVAAQEALLLEAELVQQRLGAVVAEMGSRGQPAHAARGRKGDHGAHRLQRIALAPGLA